MLTWKGAGSERRRLEDVLGPPRRGSPAGRGPPTAGRGPPTARLRCCGGGGLGGQVDGARRDAVGASVGFNACIAHGIVAWEQLRGLRPCVTEAKRLSNTHMLLLVFNADKGRKQTQWETES